VIRAAEEPSPVLFTLLSVVCVEANKGICFNDSVLRCSPLFSSYYRLKMIKKVQVRSNNIPACACDPLGHRQTTLFFFFFFLLAK
jgi:hypothetical protein